MLYWGPQVGTEGEKSPSRDTHGTPWGPMLPDLPSGISTLHLLANTCQTLDTLWSLVGFFSQVWVWYSCALPMTFPFLIPCLFWDLVAMSWCPLDPWPLQIQNSLSGDHVYYILYSVVLVYDLCIAPCKWELISELFVIPSAMWIIVVLYGLRSAFCVIF